MKDLITEIIKNISAHPEEVKIKEEGDEKDIIYYIDVDSEDIGRIIGKRGKTINALRTIVKTAGLKQGKHIRLEILENDSIQSETNSLPTED